MEQQRSSQAYKLAIKNYWRETKKNWPDALPALLLPGLGSILVSYVPPLIIAKLLVIFSKQDNVSFDQLLPYVLYFVAAWSAGEILWRIGQQFLARAEVKVMNRLYRQALGYLLAKDVAFFNNNFSGSLTKKAIAYGCTRVYLNPCQEPADM